MNDGDRPRVVEVAGGQHVFLRCCTAYRAFLDLLSVTERSYLRPRLTLGRTERLPAEVGA